MKIKKFFCVIGTLAAAVSLSGCNFPSDTEEQLKKLLASAQAVIDGVPKSSALVVPEEVTLTATSSPDVTFSDGDSREMLEVAPGEVNVVILSMHRIDDLFKRSGTMELMIDNTSGVSVDLLIKAGSIRLEKNGYDIGIVAPYSVTVKGPKIYITFYSRWFGETYAPNSMPDSKPIAVVATMSPFATSLQNTQFVMSKVQMGEIESVGEVKEVKGPALQITATLPPSVTSFSQRNIPWYEPGDYSYKEVGRFQVTCPLTEKESPCYMDTVQLSTAGYGSVLITDSISISAQAELYGQANFQYVPFVVPAGMTYEYTIYSTGEGGYLNISTLEFVVDGKRVVPKIDGKICATVLAGMTGCPKG